MLKTKELRGLAWLAAAVSMASLTGCDKAVVLNPAGDIAAQQGQLVVTATVLMLIIIVPVILLTLLFAWKYRQSNTEAEYDPDWHHSTMLELVIWTVPLFIVIALGALTWIGTHKLDPYRPLDRIDAARSLPTNVEPLEVQVVAMDWKWLFFYPEYGVATVNELAAPVDRPILFKLTATSTMNAFYVPDLAGMIYAMPGMQTQLNAVVNKPGVFPGMGSHYSGAGFSGMTFKFHGLSDSDFTHWVEKTKAEGKPLDRATYLALAKPSERDPVQRFSIVEKDLYDKVLNRCVEDGQICMRQMMAINAMGGEAYAKAVGLNLPRDMCSADSGPLVLAPLDARGLPGATTLQ
ncbi:ubiquinol oxidase subunit II [Ottowia sp.]|jgi:cytochrome o ubiquinol oxidase subunit 2|uniref:ubiquinol oxidase subunit II n=1 Tax=Ottowia sp. TaxID=1898956 RepID=UPI00260045BD|nr:ubiquinol oxidase subunit II [Ottowia sp.]MBK6615661.1 ubiquinol oxidase subunit II [Ottowia sp.]